MDTTHATVLNIDPARIGMIGFSAGARLTAMAAQKELNKIFSMMVYPAYLYNLNPLVSCKAYL